MCCKICKEKIEKSKLTFHGINFHKKCFDKYFGNILGHFPIIVTEKVRNPNEIRGLMLDNTFVMVSTTDDKFVLCRTLRENNENDLKGLYFTTMSDSITNKELLSINNGKIVL